MKTKHRRVKVFFILLLIINTYQLFAQFEHPLYNFPSPEANQQCTYGKIPTVPFTGVANISIPIYELKLRNISVPVQLSYHTSNVKPNLHPGWVGLGWTLSAGGCITRTVNCLADEQEDDKGNRLGFFGHYSELDRDDWYSKSRIDHYIEINDGSYDLYDLMPDEFNFNFCGYSGSFYMDHKGQFVVHSSSDIKVEFNKRLDCISIFDTRDKISSKVKDINGNDGNRTNRTLINKITLVTPDGIRYEFGGINATEYSIPYFNQKDGYLYATSWFLTRIVSPEGDYVDFTYEPGDPIGEAKPVYSEVMKGDNSTMSAALSKYDRECCDAQIIFPVYLAQIKSETGTTIDFKSRARTDLGYTESIFDFSDLFYSYSTSIYSDFNDAGRFNLFVESGKDFKWRALSNITVNDDREKSITTFTYYENYSHRFLTEMEKRTTKIPLFYEKYEKLIYQFSYYVDKDYSPDKCLPNRYYTDRDDHWGFYTGTHNEPERITSADYYNLKSPSIIADTQAELLRNIVYPTGGKSEFIYDRNDYIKYVTDENELKVSTYDIAGGFRIKAIVNYNRDNTLNNKIQYYYVNSISDTAKYGCSSGILAQKPKYIYKFKYEDDDYQIFSSGGMGHTLYNINGAPIGYSNVIEVAFDSKGKASGYKKYTYSNFDSDLWNETHLNEMPLYFTTSFPDHRLARYSERANERGLLQSEEFYSNSGKLKKAIQYKYHKNNEAYIRSLQFNKLYLGSRVMDFDRVLKYISAYKIYITPCLLSEKIEIMHGDNQSYSSSIKTTQYYDDQYLLTKTCTDLSNGKQLITTYTHPYNYLDDDICLYMYQKHILTPVIEKRTVIRKNGQDLFLSKEKYGYRANNGVPYVYTLKTAHKEESNEIEEYRCEATDKKGNPVDVFMKGKPEYIYLWNNCYTSPTALIKGATYSEVMSAISNGDAIDNLQLESILYSKLPNAQISFFKYYSDKKKTYETTFRQTSVSYGYNLQGLLKTVLNNGKIIKEYEYGYKIY